VILLLDNYDSFTFNLVQYLGEMQADLKVVRNDALTVAEVLALRPSHIVISPGPCTPVDAGISMDLIQACPTEIPLLGVCLGHQAIGAAFGGQVIRAPKPVHGKTAVIACNQRDLFASLPKTFTATRYHSLVVERDSLPSALEITAETDGLIMGLKHRSRSIYGLQFHPESILTEHGKTMLKNFLDMR
jgi:anthranilate synthase/aminodeoxychorismate synthase-like glutamine amidotransferase